MSYRTPPVVHAMTLVGVGLVTACQSATRTEPTPQVTLGARDPAPPYLSFSELLAQGRILRVSEHARARHGKRVRLVGYMAHLEKPADGSFYLTPVAVTCDEAGDGTAELPLTSILVTATEALAKPVEHVEGLVEVTGTFEVGRVTDSLGRAAWFHLVLDSSTPSSASTS